MSPGDLLFLFKRRQQRNSRIEDGKGNSRIRIAMSAAGQKRAGSHDEKVGQVGGNGGPVCLKKGEKMETEVLERQQHARKKLAKAT
jgi:hypothetical protein